MRKFTSLIVCLFLIFILGTFLGCKKKEPVPEEQATSWMATENESQYSEMAWEEQTGEEQEQEYVAPSLEGDEESSGEEEYQEEQEPSQEEQKPSQEEQEPSQEEEYELE